MEPLEYRHLLAAVAWTGLGDGSSWKDANNWDAGPLGPGFSDDVTIGAGANVVISLGNVNIHSLTVDPAASLSTLTSDAFNGVDGATYRFYSVATDNVGHEEQKSPIAEATTQVVTDTTPPTSGVNALPAFTQTATLA